MVLYTEKPNPYINMNHDQFLYTQNPSVVYKNQYSEI